MTMIHTIAQPTPSVSKTATHLGWFSQMIRQIFTPTPAAWMQAQDQVDRCKQLEARLSRDAGMRDADMERVRVGSFLR